MKKLIVISALLTVVLTHGQSWGFKKIKGEGEVKSEVRITDTYDKISIAGAFNVQLRLGEEGKVTIKAEENLIKHIVTENRGNKLVVKAEDGYSLLPSKGNIEVVVPFKDLESVSLSGSGRIKIKEDDSIKANRFTAAVSGSGSIFLNVESAILKGKIAGSGSLNLSGTTTDLDYEVVGSGTLKAYLLKSKNVTVKLVGSGRTEVHCEGVLNAKLIGSGTINYKGEPEKEDVTTVGSGRVRKK